MIPVSVIKITGRRVGARRWYATYYSERRGEVCFISPRRTARAAHRTARACWEADRLTLDDPWHGAPR